MSKYDDIINMPKPPLRKHKPMSIYNRAAQFAPFAALTGYDKVISEEGRETNKRIELDEYEKDEINEKLNYLLSNPNTKCSITYFIKDEYKSGGEYLSDIFTIKKVDYDNHLLITTSGNTINMEDIILIEFVKG